MDAQAEAKEKLRRNRSGQLNSVVLYGTFALLMFGPLAFGAVEPWSIFILQLGTVVLAVIWLAKQWVDGAINVRWNPLFLPMAGFGAVLLVQLVLHRTAYPHDTIHGALLYCTYGGLCFLSSQALFRTAQARKLGVIFTIYGAAVASFALVQGISSNGRLYWARQPRLGGWIYGPYVNHNHYAGLMEMLLPIPLVLSLTHLTQSKQRIAAAAAAAVMGGTVFLSGSRGGMLAVAVEIVILATALIKQKTNLRVAVSLGVFTLILVGLLAWVGGQELNQRLATVENMHSDLSSDLRLHINHDGLQMFLRRPILGWGMGSFPIIYPEFRTFYTNFFVNEAHNDYLQMLVETGLAGTGLMIWFLIVVYRRGVSKIRKWPSEVTGALTLACILGCTGILVHSAVDFNLQIPANAALFYVTCTLAAADPLLHPVRKRRVSHTPAEQTLSAAASEVV